MRLLSLLGVGICAAGAIAACTLSREGSPIGAGGATGAMSGPIGPSSSGSTLTLSAGSGGLESGSSSTLSSGGGGAGGTTASTGGSSSSGPTMEDCFDGKDNDANGKTDCEDMAACAGIAQCEPDTQAPNVVYGYLTDTDNGCNGKQPVYDCTTCGDCTAIPGSCTVDVQLNDKHDCTGNSLGAKGGPNQSCFAKVTAQGGQNVGYRTVPKIDVPAACANIQVQGNPKFFCPATGMVGTCMNGDVCVPKLPAGAAACITTTANNCPNEYKKTLLFGNNPTCQCQCGITSETCPAMGWMSGSLFDDNNCTGNMKSIVADGNCHDSMVHDVGGINFPISQPEMATCEFTTPSPQILCCK